MSIPDDFELMCDRRTSCVFFVNDWQMWSFPEDRNPNLRYDNFRRNAHCWNISEHYGGDIIFFISRLFPSVFALGIQLWLSNTTPYHHFWRFIPARRSASGISFSFTAELWLLGILHHCILPFHVYSTVVKNRSLKVLLSDVSTRIWRVFPLFTRAPRVLKRVFRTDFEGRPSHLMRPLNTPASYCNISWSLVSILAKTPSTWEVAIQGHIFLPKARYWTQLDVNQTNFFSTKWSSLDLHRLSFRHFLCQYRSFFERMPIVRWNDRWFMSRPFKTIHSPRKDR
jgi:hypothetical protein